MLTGLTNIRNSPREQRRPLIFVCHSLGGLVVKSALIFSSESISSSIRAIELSTGGVLFFGTPHQGSKTTSWGGVLRDIAALATKKANSKLLETLERESTELEFQLQRYKALEGDFRTHSFYESEPTMISGIGRHVSLHMDSTVARD